MHLTREVNYGLGVLAPAKASILLKISSRFSFNQANINERLSYQGRLK